MLKMSTDEERIVAVLHDVVEDTSVTFDDLRREGFSEEVLENVRLLTHEPEVSCEAYVARKVKLADLEDNSDIRRLSGIGDRDLERLRKYHRAWMILRSE